jgi:hypothetical protein
MENGERRGSFRPLGVDTVYRHVAARWQKWQDTSKRRAGRCQEADP